VRRSIKNNEEFRREFLKLKKQYEHTYNTLYKNVLASLDPKALPQEEEDTRLEAQVRAHLIHPLLHSLNWRMNVENEYNQTNLSVEVGVRSSGRGTRRFFDCFGFDMDELGSICPLMIVETKRPNLPLPIDTERGDSFLPSTPQIELPNRDEKDVATNISEYLSGKEMNLPMGEWPGWLATLRDYTKSTFDTTGQTPKRVVITNGDWLVIFLDPDDAFLNESRCDPDRIIVFENRQRIVDRYKEVFNWLWHDYLTDKAQTFITPGQLGFNISRSTVTSIIRGIHLLHRKDQGFERIKPSIEVRPIVFLRREHGHWIRVEYKEDGYSLTSNRDGLQEHLGHVAQRADELLGDINGRLECALLPANLGEHYSRNNNLDELKGVKCIKLEYNIAEYLVVTGVNAHFLSRDSHTANCPYHCYIKGRDLGHAINSPKMTSGFDEPCFFPDGDDCHCAHSEIYASKREPVHASNRERCGPRSGDDGSPFCEIYPFERFLCCKACVFHPICSVTEVFRLPCPDQVS